MDMFPGNIDFKLEAKKQKATRPNLSQFRLLVFAQAFKRILLRGDGRFFWIDGELKTRSQPKKAWDFGPELVSLYLTRTNRPRSFRSVEGALELLWSIGVKSVEIQLDQWRPGKGPGVIVKRLDMAERLKFAHEYARLEAKSKKSREKQDEL